MAVSKSAYMAKAITLVALFVVGMPLMPLLVSGRWDWPEAWAYATLSIVSFAISRFLAARKDSGILAERANSIGRPDAEPFDKLMLPLLALGSVALPLACGLDERFGWSLHYTSASKLLAFGAFIGGLTLSSWALVANRFFSGTVRIQAERGHSVVSEGPYAWVRHPGYAGGLMTYLATPILLDSSWAFIPAIALTLTLIIRTNLEDKALRIKLPGYEDYAKRVRFKMMPWLW